MPLSLAFIPPYLASGSLGIRAEAWGMLAALCGAVATLLASRGRPREAAADLFILGMVAALGLGWGADRRRPMPLPMGLPELAIRGTAHQAGAGLEADRLSVAHEGRWRSISGRYLVRGSKLRAGAFLSRAYLVSLEEPQLPGLADRNRSRKWRFFRGVLEVKEAWSLPDLEGHSGSRLRARVQGGLARRIGRSLPEDFRSIIPMLIWGESGVVEDDIQRIFRSTGTMHLLAISGLHVTLVCLLLEFLLRLVIRVPMIRIALLLTVVCGYGALVGPLPSVVRSIVMAGALLIGKAMGRPSSVGGAFWIALLLVSCLTPGELCRPGFQLSYAGTAALILCPKVPKLLLPVVGSAVAVAATSGILWAHFGEAAPIAVIANLTGIPAFGPVLVAVLWGLVWGDPANATLQAFAWGPAGILIKSWVAPLRLVLPVGERLTIRTGCGEFAGLAATCAVLALLYAASKSGRLAHSLLFGTIGILVLIAGPAGPGVRRWLTTARVEAVVLPVGQGDSTLLKIRGGHSYLIDTGPGGMDRSRGKRILAPALRSHGVGRLTGIFLTHGDEDHIGGLRGLLLAGIRVDTIYVSGAVDTRLCLPRRSVPPVRVLRAPWKRIDGPLQLSLLHPGSSRANSANEGSLVLRVEGGPGSLVVPGDLGGDAEEGLSMTEKLEPTQVLLAGHHGSAGSTGDRWLDRLDPKVVLISCGPRNRHGHPSPPLRKRLALRRIEVHRTDRQGQLMLRWVDGGLWFRSGRCGRWKAVL